VEKYKEIVSFIRDLYGKPEGFIPLHAPVFAGNEKKYLEECIDSTFVSSVGKFVDQFEEKMAEYTGSTRAVACVNGTNALHLALKLLGVEPDTEVITQPLTFIATTNAISYCYARPVFLDVDLDTMGLSPDSLRQWLKESTIRQLNKTTNSYETVNKLTGRRISACVPMHTFGHPCRIEEIVQICDEYDIPVVEDAAESLGSFCVTEMNQVKDESFNAVKPSSKGNHRHTGTFGKIGILSFNGNKVITTGGGGMLLFKDEELAARAKHLSTQAKTPHPWEFIHDAVGYNYRMPNINAAIGLAQLEHLPEFLNNKRKIADAYKEFFGLPDKDFYYNNSRENLLSSPLFMPEPHATIANYWLNCIILPDKGQRDEFLKYTNENGIMTRPAWQLLNKLEFYRNCETDGLANAEFLADRLVNIPSSVNL
jgi:aminotransferase in exopolysaccharide biosynthesis